jgi:hypothetical protein
MNSLFALRFRQIADGTLTTFAGEERKAKGEERISYSQ